MDKARRLVLVSLALLLLSAAIVSTSSAQGPIVIPPDSTVQGLSYGEWAARYFRWTFALPASENPLFGMADACIVQEVGHVRLVGFSPMAAGPQDCGKVSGRDLLFMLAPVGTECSLIEPFPFHGDDEASLNACVEAFSWSGLEWSLDGVPLNVSDAFIVRSPMYRLRWQKDNMFGLTEPGATWSVARAPFLMFAPLAPGQHTIELHGVINGPDGSTFAGNATLLVTVE